jgi:ABC-2 type transport system ATP-binding protein
VFDDSVVALKQRFMRTKRIELKLLEPTAQFDLRGLQVVRQEPYVLDLDVDTSMQLIEGVIARLVEHGGVADITIEDPPLEAIIAEMYRAEAVSSLLSGRGLG